MRYFEKSAVSAATIEKAIINRFSKLDELKKGLTGKRTEPLFDIIKKHKELGTKTFNQLSYLRNNPNLKEVIFNATDKVNRPNYFLERNSLRNLQGRNN